MSRRPATLTFTALAGLLIAAVVSVACRPRGGPETVGGGADTANVTPAPEADPLARQETRTPVPSDINDAFLDPTKPSEEWSERWEIESREVFACRDEIVRALALKAGERVADIGTGTGLFLGPLSRAVGESGQVFAVDIAQKFVDHVRRRAQREEMANVVAVLSNERSIELADASVDVVFVCDSYHHFEYHEDMLRSIHRALKPGGRLVLVDFERIPGKTREWLLGHVRAGKEVVLGELRAAGFERVDEVIVEGFEENYLVRFRRPAGR